MGTKTYGVTFTQTGVPVALSSDYQKVIDSRWIFMEIANEGDIAYSFSGAAGSLHYERIVIYRHNLGYMPAFESTIDLNGADPFSAGSPGVFADKNTIFLRRIISGATIGCNITGYYRLYALPILNDYEAPVELVSGASAPKTDYGMKFVNGQVPNVTPADNSVLGFSVDTTKKILSVHKTGLQNFDGSAAVNTITHNMGYPPTYLLAPVNDDELTQECIGPLIRGISDMLIKATTTTLQVKGVQSTVAGKYGLIILKDPVEIAS